MASSIDIADWLESMAQDEFMVDQYFLDNGKRLNEAAKEIRELRGRVSKAERDTAHANELGNQADKQLAELQIANDRLANAHNNRVAELDEQFEEIERLESALREIRGRLR